MATYFHGGPEIQPVDGLQTLYLMNPSYVGYSDATGPQAAQQQPNMVFLNSPLSSLNSIPQSQQQHQHQQQQHFVGIPLHPTQQPTAQYNIWAPTPVDVQAHSGQIRQAGLSLSLQSTEEAKIAAGPSTNGLQSVLMGSKYLKAAQLLLDEVASVGKDGRSEAAAAAGMARKGDEKSGVKSGKDLEGEGGEGKRGAELSTAERQELQMKKAKLVNMLDEVIIQDY